MFLDQTRRIRIAVVSPIIVQYDAISQAVLDTISALSIDGRFDVVHFGCRCEFDYVPHQTCYDARELLTNPFFLNADIAIFHFGVYHSLFDALNSSYPPVKITRFHNITPLEFLSGLDNDMARKALIQIHALKNSNRIWADSKTNADFLIQLGFAPTIIKVIPISVSEPAEFKLVDKDFDGTLKLLFLGRISQAKGVRDLIASVAPLNKKSLPFSLTIAGNTLWSDRNFLELVARDIERYQLREVVKLTGTVSNEMKAQLLRTAHVLVLPSYHEGFCKPVIEGFRSGCIPIVYDAYNLPLIINGLGRVVPTGSIAGLTEAIECISLALLQIYRSNAKGKISLDFGELCVQDFDRLIKEYAESFSYKNFRSEISRDLHRLIEQINLLHPIAN